MREKGRWRGGGHVDKEETFLSCGDEGQLYACGGRWRGGSVVMKGGRVFVFWRRRQIKTISSSREEGKHMPDGRSGDAFHDEGRGSCASINQDHPLEEESLCILRACQLAPPPPKLPGPCSRFLYFLLVVEPQLATAVVNLLFFLVFMGLPKPILEKSSESKKTIHWEAQR